MEPAQEQWDETVKELHVINREKVINGLALQFGDLNINEKVKNFQDLKFKPLSVLAFHNKFLDQIRNSYVIGGYYPALTGACALGERILNHLILLLRDYHKSSPEYKKIYRKSSFDHWPTAIDTLESWGELLPEATTKIRELHEKRNRAIHFNPEIDYEDKELALEAVHLIQDFVKIQFSAFGDQPWYFCVPGEIYIKKEWENKPLIQSIFIPNSLLVGPKHVVESVRPHVLVNDQFDYDDKNISDDEFYILREKNQ
ncbi:hypothetical protein [Aeromonas caviae]|uniref:hypothetical protein n=1 Tax=Aeromonas caviae TaxID=648 RepID=UPI003EC6DFA2